MFVAVVDDAAAAGDILMTLVAWAMDVIVATAVVWPAADDEDNDVITMGGGGGPGDIDACKW